MGSYCSYVKKLVALTTTTYRGVPADRHVRDAPAADAGRDEGDTEAPRRNRRAPRSGRMQKRKHTGKARPAAATPLRPTDDGDESDLQ